MYDRVTFRLETQPKMLPDGSYTSDPLGVEPYLDDVAYNYQKKTQIHSITGRLQDLFVKLYPNGIYVNGSLSRFLRGLNVYPLTPQSTKEAITKLEDSLHVDMGDAKVTFLEFGKIFVMRERVEEYMPLFCSYKDYSLKNESKHSLRFDPKAKEAKFVIAAYDKIQEMKKERGTVIPDGLSELNLLKLEIRLKRLTEQLKEPSVTLKNLPQRDFYKKLCKLFRDTFCKIEMRAAPRPVMQGTINKPSDAKDLLLARLLAQADPDMITNFISELKRANVFPDRKNYTRVKKELQGISKKATLTTTEPLVEEIKNSLLNVGSYD